ncbi:hypothetical protein LXL04_032718 [Taraxacum kok-saghyz]
MKSRVKVVVRLLAYDGDRIGRRLVVVTAAATAESAINKVLLVVPTMRFYCILRSELNGLEFKRGKISTLSSSSQV